MALTAWAEPHYPQYMLLANQAFEEKDYDEAVTQYQKALADRPDFWPAYQGIGNCYLRKDKSQLALDAYEKALSLDPDSAILKKKVKNLRDKLYPATPTPVPTPKPNLGHRFLGLGLGADIPAQGLSGHYGVGSGMEFFVGYTEDDRWGLLITASAYSFSSSQTNDPADGLEIVPAIKYRFDMNGIKPYITEGVGLNINLSNSNNVFSTTFTSQSQYLLQSGLGVEIPAAPKARLFIEVKYNYVFSPSVLVFVPLNAGMVFDLP